MVKLRQWRQQDIQALADLANNSRIWDQVRDYFPHPYTRKDAQKWISNHAGKSQEMNFAIVVNNQIAGAISLIPKNDIYRLSAEIGYWLGEPHWGKGIMSEAVSQIIEYGRKKHPELIRIYAEVFAFNKASSKVLEKNGFHLESVRKNAIIKNGLIGDDEVWVRLFEESSTQDV